jgi:subtilisin
MPKKESKAQGISGARNPEQVELTESLGPRIIAPGTTGRHLVLMREGSGKAGVQALHKLTGISVAHSADFITQKGLGAAALQSESGVFFDAIGVAVVDTAPENIQGLGVESIGDSAILAVEPERIVYALADYGPLGTAQPPSSPMLPSSVTAFDSSYLRGYRDAVNLLTERILRGGVPDLIGDQFSAASVAEVDFTWGLQGTKVPGSMFSAQGIRVAVLDTGLDPGHPDFIGRVIVSNSFVPGEAVQDGHGHGTHCIGTACGPRVPGALPRYGIGYNAEIYVGKVLSNLGSGTDSSILAGINWAVENQCAVVSMSLGASVAVGQPYSQVYEQVARRSLAAGTLIIAAAGNDSHRPTNIVPVSHPANCPSIMAVAAVDAQIQIAFFSNGGLNPQGGQVDVAGPGVAVRSSWPRPTLYHTISGTSMATPHAAGLAALLAEANPTARGAALGALLVQGARRLSLPSRDVGSGLVQAP